MNRDLRIDDPGAGTWIMDRVGGPFNERWDHSFSSHVGDRILGGFVVCNFMGNSMTVHMAGEDKRWCSRDLLWLMFHYAFEQCGCHKMLTPIPSNRDDAIAMDMRAGWGLEACVYDAYAPGVHMLILGMTRDQCPWLKYKPRVWMPRNARAA